jgi:hypothetical protein
MGIQRVLSKKIFEFSIICCTVIGLILHIWTAALTFAVYGFLDSMLALAFPVVAEFFWFFKMLISKGIKSAYCLTVIIFCGFSLIAVKFMVDVDDE